MSEVLQFRSRRAPRPHRDDDLFVCSCGSSSFELQETTQGGGTGPGVVVLSTDGRITGYTGVPHCVDCGNAHYL